LIVSGPSSLGFAAGFTDRGAVGADGVIAMGALPGCSNTAWRADVASSKLTVESTSANALKPTAILVIAAGRATGFGASFKTVFAFSKCVTTALLNSLMTWSWWFISGDPDNVVGIGALFMIG
jgi:hypothetical protein